MEDAKTIFGRRLRLIRKSQRITLEELGRRASLGYKHIADIERGEKSPSLDAIQKLAGALKVSLHELFLPEDVPPPKRVLSLKELAARIERDAPAPVIELAREMLTQIYGKLGDFGSKPLKYK